MMKHWMFLAAFMVCALPFVVANDTEEEYPDVDDPNSHIIKLHTDDFDEKTLNGEVWIVEFYSLTCGFCRMFQPEWEKLADEVHEDEIPLNVAKVNVRTDRDLSSRFECGKLPCIKLFRDGEVFTLPQPRNSRTTDDYIEYALETWQEVEDAEAFRVAEEIRLQAEIDERSKLVFLDVDNFEDYMFEGNWLIDFYGPKCGYCKKLAPTWEELGFLVNDGPDKTSDSYDFRVAKFDAAAGFKYTRQFKGNPWPAIRMLRDGKVYQFTESRNFDMTLQDYVDWATEGYKEEEDTEDMPQGFEPEYLANAIKRAKRKAKWGKKKKAAEAASEGKKPTHDEL